MENHDEVIQSSNRFVAYYDFGYNYFGPFLLGFVKWLQQALIKDNINKVFFFARDGYMMEQAFSIINKDNSIKLQYVHFSRNSLRFGLIHKCEDYISSLQYLSKSRFIQAEELLAYYGFSKEESQDIVDNLNITLGHNFIFEDLPKNKIVENIFMKNKPLIYERSRRSFYILQEYLAQIGMYGKFAIVDIGWHGSMQDYLQKNLDFCKKIYDVYGYYVGVKTEKNFQGNTRGYLYSNENPSLRKSVLCFFGGYEKLFQSTEGSTLDYCKNKQNIIEPVLKEYEYEHDMFSIKAIQAWQKGALNYVKVNRDEEKTHCFLANKLVEFGKNPDLEHLKLFKFLYNTDAGKIYYLPQKKIWEYSPKEFVYALGNSVWKTGFMKEAFRISLPYFWIYKILRK